MRRVSPIEAPRRLPNIDAEIREQLRTVHGRFEDVMALADPAVEGVFDTPDIETGRSLYEKLADQRMQDPRHRKLSYAEHLEAVRTIDRDERSRRVVQHATNLAKSGRLTAPVYIEAVAKLRPSHGVRHELAGDSLIEYVRSLDYGSPASDNFRRTIPQQLGFVLWAIDREPTPERRHIKRVIDEVVKNDSIPGVPFPPHTISELQKATPSLLAQRQPGSRENRAREELEDLLRRRRLQPGISVARQHDLDGLIASLDSDPVTPVERYGKPQSPTSELPEPNRGRKAVASVTALGISATTMGTLATPAAASPNLAPVSATVPIAKTPAAPATIESSSTPVEIDFTTGAATPVTPGQTNPTQLKPLAPFPETKVELIPLAKPGENHDDVVPLSAALPALSSRIVDVGNLASAPETAPVAPPASLWPAGTKVVSITLPPSAAQSNTHSAENIAALTQQQIPIAAADLGTSPTLSNTPVANSEQIQTSDAQTVYAQMVQQGAPLGERIIQLQTALQAHGYSAAPFQAAQSAIQNQAALLEAAAQNNPMLSDVARQQIRRDLDTAVTLVAYPSYLPQANAATLVDTKDSTYVSADAQVVYDNPATYGAATDPTLLSELSQLDPSVAGTISKLLASADALNQTPQQQVNALSGIDPAAASTLRGRLSQLAKTVLGTSKANQASTPRTPAQTAPLPHQAAPTPERLTTPHEIDLAAAEAMIRLGGKWQARGQALKEMLATGQINAIAATATIGNFMEESGMNPHNVQNGCANDSPTLPDNIADICGYGLGQWTSAGRQQALREYAAAHNSSTGSFHIQVGFAIHELTGAFSATLQVMNAASDPSEAAYLARVHYESPDPRVANDVVREAGARQVYEEFMRLRASIVRQQDALTRNAAHHALTADVSHLTVPAGGPFEYTLRVPTTGNAAGHDEYYSNQIADTLKGIDGESACGVYSIGMIYASLTGQPTAAAIQKVHDALVNAGAYADGPGMLDSHKMLNVIQSLGLKVNTIQFERSASTLSDTDMAQVRQALSQNNQGTPTLILAHTAKLVSEVLGNVAGNYTSGHFLTMYAYNDDGYYVANPGNRADSPASGVAIPRSGIENWLDGAYAISK